MASAKTPITDSRTITEVYSPIDIDFNVTVQAVIPAPCRSMG